jgi:hypothetical protein
MCSINSEKSSSFVQPPASLLANTVVESLVPNISQEDREMLKAGYDIYHILSHRETLVLIIDTGEKQIVENEGNITLKFIPNNLEDLKSILSNSELSDATVTQLLLHK